MSQNVAIIGIAGGTGAGKTVLAEALADKLGKEEAVVLPQDAYYKDRSHIPPEERQKINYDHPDSFENDLLVDHLEKLSDWDSIERPVYNFTTHTREESVTVQPAPVVILEGIMVLVSEKIRSVLDYKIFVDTDADIRILRRIERDIQDRDRDFQNVKNQYFNSVRPMHLAFVEPSKRYADIIIPRGYNEVAIEVLFNHLENYTRRSDFESR